MSPLTFCSLLYLRSPLRPFLLLRSHLLSGSAVLCSRIVRNPPSTYSRPCRLGIPRSCWDSTFSAPLASRPAEQSRPGPRAPGGVPTDAGEAAVALCLYSSSGRRRARGLGVGRVGTPSSPKGVLLSWASIARGALRMSPNMETKLAGGVWATAGPLGRRASQRRHLEPQGSPPLTRW